MALAQPPIQDPIGSWSWLNWYKSVTTTVNSPVTNLPATGVSPGSYNSVTVGTDGRVTSGNNLAYLTSNQSITLSGDATGSGTTAITVTINPTILKTQQVPSASTKTVTHSIPINCNGTTYYILLSSTGP